MDGQTVLVVEDDPDIRTILQVMLEEIARVRAVFAGDGAEALQQVRLSRPDLVLLDFDLPRLDGGEVARRLKSSPTTRRVPVVAVTGRPRDDLADADFDGYVAKPFDVAFPAEVVEGYLAEDRGRESEPLDQAERAA